MKTRAFGAATLYTLKNQNGLVLEVSDFGATWHSLLVPDQDGNLCDVVLGCDTPEEYVRANAGFGATVGRNGNRIGGAKFDLNGNTYRLEDNDNGNNLHSGLDYYHFRMWDVKQTTENSITFGLHSLDGDQGFPGAFDVEVTYTLTEDDAVQIDYRGTVDADTIANLTNHSYFNLNGHASGDVLGHTLWIDADAYVATDEQLIPTGEIVAVEGTPMDFRKKKTVGRDINQDYGALNCGGGYDHNWCLNNDGKYAKVAEITGEASGITMEVYTDLPGVQVYAGNFLDNVKGKGGVTYQKRQGICFETQHYPDAINHANFPSPILRAGEVYQTRTTYLYKRGPIRA